METFETKLTKWTKVVFHSFPLDRVDKTHCAALVQGTTLPGIPTSLWRAGIRVEDASSSLIPPGTAIATFGPDGRGNLRYPQTDPPGRHCGLYVRHDVHGLTLMDQWAANPARQQQAKEVPSERTIRFRGATSLTGYQTDGSRYYVVKHVTEMEAENGL